MRNFIRRTAILGGLAASVSGCLTPGPGDAPPDTLQVQPALALDDCSTRVRQACVDQTGNAGQCDFLATETCGPGVDTATCFDAVFGECTTSCWDAAVCAPIAEAACAAAPPPPPISDCEDRLFGACVAHTDDADTCAWLTSSLCEAPPSAAACQGLIFERCTASCWDPSVCAPIAAGACAAAPPSILHCEARVQGACADYTWDPDRCVGVAETLCEVPLGAWTCEADLVERCQASGDPWLAKIDGCATIAAGACGQEHLPPSTPVLSDCGVRVDHACLTVINAPALCDWVVSRACATPPTAESCAADLAEDCLATSVDPVACPQIAALACGATAPPPPPPADPLPDCQHRLIAACDQALGDPAICDGIESLCWWTPPRAARCREDLARTWSFLTPIQVAALAELACAEDPTPPIAACDARVSAACVAEFPGQDAACDRLVDEACAMPPSEAACVDMVREHCQHACWSQPACEAVAEVACAPPPCG